MPSVHTSKVLNSFTGQRVDIAGARNTGDELEDVVPEESGCIPEGEDAADLCGGGRARVAA